MAVIPPDYDIPHVDSRGFGLAAAFHLRDRDLNHSRSSDQTVAPRQHWRIVAAHIEMHFRVHSWKKISPGMIELNPVSMVRELKSRALAVQVTVPQRD